jgi:hypothetical protein
MVNKRRKRAAGPDTKGDFNPGKIIADVMAIWPIRVWASLLAGRFGFMTFW